MLVLARKENQSIIIGDAIKITIVGRSGSSIRVGVEAPRDLKVMREELEIKLEGTSLPTEMPLTSPSKELN
ncbi:MAG: carbon storage regulator [Planctomycetaceae bacterium]|nr:carbon storage regulator [Planctomycetaceae bacterium]